ncbi:MAG TPA: electron transport complex subunit RsxC [Thermotoga sp.]|nr:electron transport complex subunit RsxC [Thermotoga sp.]
MKLFTFKGGVHPPEKKELSKNREITKAPLPNKVFVSMANHAGAPAKPVVEPGQEVKTGQVIGEPTAFISAYVHSPVTGRVIEIKKMLHPVLGKPIDTVVIEKTADDDWELLPHGDFERFSKEELIDTIKKAGIVGLGGAMFPTHVKLSPPPEKKIDILIINGAECEPYLTIDYRLMLEKAEDIAQGILIMKKILGVEKVIVGIENNKLDAIENMKKVLKGIAEICALKTKYPQGSEKQLIYAVTGRKVPVGGLPMDVGVVVQNVGTAIAIKEAVVDGKPLIERGLTVTGEGVNEPKNIIARIGSLVSWILEFCGGVKDETNRIILGGPMMGISIKDVNTPILKGTSGIVALLPEKPLVSKPCIRCSKCVEVCPMNLQPYLLYLLALKKRYDEAAQEGLMDCIECGSCAFICPSKIEHIRYIKLAKNVYRALRRGRK